MTGKKRVKPWVCYGFKVRYRGNGVQVDEGQKGHKNGKRIQKSFKTVAEAENHCRARRVELENKGTDARGLSDRDRLDAVEARKLLGTGSILDAVQYYVKHHAAGAGAQKAVAELVKEYLEADGRRGGKTIKRRERTIREARNRLAVFVKAYGTRPAGDVTRADVEGWLSGGGWSGLHLRNYLAPVKALFSYAVRKEYLTANPAEKIEVATPDQKAPEIMAPRDVARLLAAAVKHDADLVPRLALSFFAGLRTAELDRLDWQNVNLSAGLVTVTIEASKMRRQRHVKIASNLVQWLVPYRKENGPVWRLSPVSYQHRAAELAKGARVKIPHNAGRHAFASYHFALHGDAAKTAGELGHADARLLLDVYRNIHTTNGKAITAATAAEYFAIKPQGAVEVIPIEAAN